MRDRRSRVRVLGSIREADVLEVVPVGRAWDVQ